MPGRGGATVLDDLPEWIVVDEILVRLPAKDLLRCRTVHTCWRSATSTDKFMLDHHRRQPLLPILSHGFARALDEEDARLFVSHDAGAGQQKLYPVLIRSSHHCGFHAALDGLLIVSQGPGCFICNPATRRCAPLPTPPAGWGYRDHIAGFFRHQPSGEYRVLWVATPTYYDPADDAKYPTYYHVLAAGSNNPRCVQQACRTATTSLKLVLRTGLPYDSPVHHHGSLHWKLGTPSIVAFNTTAEIFRLMSSPAAPAQLNTEELFLEMDDTLALCRISSKRDTIDVWMMQDYDAEIWSFKHRINLSVVDPPCSDSVTMLPKMAVLNEDELLIQFSFGPVLRYGIDGKFLGYVKGEEDRKLDLQITRHYLQESVIPLPLFHERREEGVPAFFVGL